MDQSDAAEEQGREAVHQAGLGFELGYFQYARGHGHGVERSTPPSAQPSLARPARTKYLFYLALDLLKVHELSIDGGEPDVRDLVEVAEPVHHHLTDLSTGDLHAA